MKERLELIQKMLDKVSKLPQLYAINTMTVNNHSSITWEIHLKGTQQLSEWEVEDWDDMVTIETIVGPEGVIDIIF